MYMPHHAHIRPKRTSLKYGITWLQPEWDQPASRILSTTSPQKRPEARPNECFTEIHPKRRLGCNGCPTGRGCRRLRRRALGHIKTPCEPVVDIAALVLRTRCCGGRFRPRREP